MAKRATLKDIAESLNISITTVSRALNNKADINQETKASILSLAEELNYRPNALAISLRKSQYNVIGVILPMVDHYFFTTVLKGIMNKAHKANHLVIIGESMHDVEKEKEILNQFMSHCVTGVLISPCRDSQSSDNLEILKTKRVPHVLVDRPIGENLHSCVKYDDVKGASLAVEHLISQGYRHIAMIRGKSSCAISNARLEGYKDALNSNGLKFNDGLVLSCTNADKEDGYLLSKQLLLSKNRPDAFFVITDNIAAGIYKTADELNLRIPEELGIVGYSDSQIAKHLSPKLSSVKQSGEAMGEMAFDFLQQSIISNSNTLHKTFDAQLVIRDSSVRAN